VELASLVKQVMLRVTSTEFIVVRTNLVQFFFPGEKFKKVKGLARRKIGKKTRIERRTSTNDPNLLVLVAGLKKRRVIKVGVLCLGRA